MKIELYYIIAQCICFAHLGKPTQCRSPNDLDSRTTFVKIAYDARQLKQEIASFFDAVLDRIEILKFLGDADLRNMRISSKNIGSGDLESERARNYRRRSTIPQAAANLLEQQRYKTEMETTNAKLDAVESLRELRMRFERLVKNLNEIKDNEGMQTRLRKNLLEHKQKYAWMPRKSSIPKTVANADILTKFNIVQCVNDNIVPKIHEDRLQNARPDYFPTIGIQLAQCRGSPTIIEFRNGISVEDIVTKFDPGLLTSF
eukprot:Lankesteria_metandrocarpae@DN2838_c0_g1_i2.p1